MNRNSQHSAIILRIAPFGETHGSVELLTPDHGLVRAIAYGLRARRGTLRGKVVPFALGTLYLYTDPRRDDAKIVDFDVHRYAVALPQDLTAWYHAGLWAEVIWRTRASGDAGAEVYDLLLQGLDLLEAIADAAVSPEQRRHQVQLVSSLVLWRYLAILGLRPSLEECGIGDTRFAAEESRFYDRREGVLVGSEWADSAMVHVPSGTARLLAAAEPMTLPQAAALPVTAATLAATKTFVIAAIQDAVEVPLNTLRVASGLL